MDHRPGVAAAGPVGTASRERGGTSVGGRADLKKPRMYLRYTSGCPRQLLDRAAKPCWAVAAYGVFGKPVITSWYLARARSALPAER